VNKKKASEFFRKSTQNIRFQFLTNFDKKKGSIVQVAHIPEATGSKDTFEMP